MEKVIFNTMYVDVMIKVNGKNDCLRIFDNRLGKNPTYIEIQDFLSNRDVNENITIDLTSTFWHTFHIYTKETDFFTVDNVSVLPKKFMIALELKKITEKLYQIKSDGCFSKFVLVEKNNDGEFIDTEIDYDYCKVVNDTMICIFDDSEYGYQCVSAIIDLLTEECVMAKQLKEENKK